jgi:type IV pilus assembly protein PilC
VIDPLVELNPDLEVPLITRIVAGLGHYVIDHWLFLIVALVLLIVAIALLRRTLPVKAMEDYLKLKFPVLGKLLGRPIVAASVSGTFSTLIHSGIPVISCLKILSQTQTNTVVARSLRKTAQVVEEGGSLVTPMEESGIYPPLMIDMLAVGDESGTLDTVLEKISETFTEEVDMALDAFTRILEAFVMLLVGAVVLVVALAAYLPYFTMYTKLDM